MFNRETIFDATRLYFLQWTKKKTIAAMVVVFILAGAIVVAMDPAKQLAKYRNSTRRSDVILIINALYQYSLDHENKFPVELAKGQQEICKSNGAQCDGLLDVSMLIAGDYISKIPTDPSAKTQNGTGYVIMKSESGRITVSAPAAENATISVTR